MERDEIFALIERVQEACPPKCKVEIIPTKQKGEVYLVIVQIPSTEMALTESAVNVKDEADEKLKSFFERNLILRKVYFWELQKVRHLHYETILPVINDTEHFRVLYCCGNKFVFYTHTFGCLTDCGNMFDYIGVKSKDNKDFRYIGHCRNIDVLIGHLMMTFEMF